MSEQLIKEFVLTDQSVIARALVLAVPAFAQPPGSQTIIRVWFLESSPDADAPGESS